VGNATKPNDTAVPQGPDEVRALLKRAQKGDVSTLPAVRVLLRDPTYVRLLGGELAEVVELSFLRAMAKDDLAFQAAARQKLEQLRADLMGAVPSPVERLLAERVAACWLQVQDAEMRYAQAQGDLTLRQGDYHQRRMDAANRRYLAAVKALAVVRRLAVPVLQVNVARKQVNVAAQAAVDPRA
jgi:hypothetical protein